MLWKVSHLNLTPSFFFQSLSFNCTVWAPSSSYVVNSTPVLLSGLLSILPFSINIIWFGPLDGLLSEGLEFLATRFFSCRSIT